ncbi:MAG: hypothetical protein WCP35_00090 [Verrucomicrobiota bacterium]
MKIVHQFSVSISRNVRPGFALVITLALMILLTVIAVGLLTLSSISLRASSQAHAIASAQTNARMALVLAIGELQKQLGSDRRISAKADILDENPASGTVEGVANPHYLGVWESWDTWLTDKKMSLTIQDTYKRGRDSSLFRAWLVSHPEASKFATAISAAPTPDMVVLCGEHSTSPAAPTQVKAGRIPIHGDKRVTGSYAWWISDESQKIRLDLIPRANSSSPVTAQITASHTGRPGIEKLTGMATYNTSQDSLAKMITTGQAAISSPEAAGHFHDLTAYSVGLLTDVRAGGFKSDLNLAFESDTLPEEMANITLFGLPYDAPIRPMSGVIGAITPQNPSVAPMSWRQMREYYRLYRSDFSNSSLMKPIVWSGDKPETKRFLMGDKGLAMDTMGYGRDLVMLRQSWVISTSTEPNPTNVNKTDYCLLAVPVLYLWNPYNITLKVAPGSFASFAGLDYAMNLQHLVVQNGVAGPWVKNLGSTGQSQAGRRMVPEDSSSAQIEFQPGEVRVFSANTEIIQGSGLSFSASPGYSAINNIQTLKYTTITLATDSPPPSFALRFGDTGSCNSQYFGASNRSALIYKFQILNKEGGYYEDGTPLKKELTTADEAIIGATSVDWVSENELPNAWIIKDDTASLAKWGDLAAGTTPQPVAIISVVAKCAELLDWKGLGTPFSKDYRNRTWLHAPPTRLSNFLMQPNDLSRADSAYQLHFCPVNGYQEVSQYLQANERNGFFGGGYTAALGQTHLPLLNLPSAPIMNLGSFAGIRMDHARDHVPAILGTSMGSFYKLKPLGHVGAAFGAGIGNAYAHPMIAPDRVYTRNQLGVDNGYFKVATGVWQNGTGLSVCDDDWDHLFLANEGLWDSWFCSGLAPEVSNGSVISTIKTVAENFFAATPKKATLVPQSFLPNLRNRNADELAALAEQTSKGNNGWEAVASYMLNKGQFNVNSTSKEAWKALLLSLCDRPLAVNDAKTGNLTVNRDASTAKVSRFPLANSTHNGASPGDDSAWCGIRSLSDAQVDKLAEQIVRQVKLRGPFLNMTEFINRRLSTDATGVTGALQAAIDWDEFDAGYDGSTQGGGESINKAYKIGDAMITKANLPTTDYPNEKAACGSRYAGIPGYVMQSDLLQGISSSISVRGDTFLIRAYGECLLPDGKVAAKAWCEAVAQRQADFIDPRDAADKKMRGDDGTPDPQKHKELLQINQTFGRQFKIISFRWLKQDEI